MNQRLAELLRIDEQPIMVDDGIQLLRRSAGRLVVTSGRLTACDPSYPETPPFRRRIPLGTYPVSLLISIQGSDERVALAQLVIHDDSVPERFEPAMLDAPSRVAEPAYGVDSAMGCFADADVWNYSLARGNLLGEGLGDAMADREWGEFVIDSRTGLNVIAFWSGMGDGVYSSYWGFDGSGRAVCLVTDFLLPGEDEPFVWPAGHSDAPVVPPKQWWQFWR